MRSATSSHHRCLYHRLGATGWARRCHAELDELRGAADSDGVDVFQRDGPVWTIAYGGRQAHLPDAKGLHDIAVLLAAPGCDLHVFTLLGRTAPVTGAAPMLDDRAKAAYGARLIEIEDEIDESESWRDSGCAERARAERDALVAALTAAAGLGGRPRRLGDEAERARKTVTARIRDALRRIERSHPELAVHLRASISTGTSCAYAPDGSPPRWRL